VTVIRAAELDRSADALRDSRRLANELRTAATSKAAAEPRLVNRHIFRLDSEQIAHRLAPHCEDPLVARAPLGAVIERAVRVGAVAVVLAVGDVVLDVVRHEVVQREAVVRRDEVDARERSALLAERVG